MKRGLQTDGVAQAGKVNNLKRGNSMSVKFQKAKPMQAFYKGSVYGPPGSGKTYTTLLQAEGFAKSCGKRIAFVDTERGTDFYTEKFDFDAIYTQSLAVTIEAVQSLDPNEHGVIIIDSISHLWESAISAFEGKRTRNESANGIPMNAWGGIKKPYKTLIRWLMDCPFHVFILGRQKNVFEDDDKGQLRKTSVAMKAEGETAYEPHICCRMESRQNAKDTSKSTYFAIYEKDRTGLLAGRTFPNPNFKTIECILPLLCGAEQAQSENPDEVMTRDAEALTQLETDREDKSVEIADACQALILTAETLAALGEVEATMKPKKKFMLKTDTDKVRKCLKDRESTLTRQLVAA